MEWHFLMDWKFYLLVVLLAATYKLGFARPQTLIRTIIIYFVLVLGSLPLYALMLFGLPMIPALSVAVLLFILAQIPHEKVRIRHSL